MTAALLLLDLQRDFLDRPGVAPPPGEILAATAGLLAACRQRGLPVLHVHTRVRADGADRMPHWVAQGISWCVAGTPGAGSPAAVAPRTDEPVFFKQFFSAFRAPDFERALTTVGARPLIVAGLYLHGCVRSTVLDAYERGFDVWIAADATGSADVAHAQASRRWLDGRAATFMTAREILAALPAAAAGAQRARS